MSKENAGFAEALSPTDLLEAGLANIPRVDGTDMPMLIHQSWKSTLLPPLFETLSKSWRVTYPDWRWVLWTDEDNLELVRTRFPEYLEVYQAFPREIYRVDFVRNLYMLEFGGIYADLDFDSFRPLDPVFQAYSSRGAAPAFLGRFAKAAPGQPSYFENHSLPTSTPAHPFWRFPANRAKEIWYSRTIQSEEGWSTIQEHVEETTGPVALLRSLDKCNAQRKDGDPIVVELAPKLIYPFAWYSTVEDGSGRMELMADARKGFNLEAARKKYNNGTAYACTYWGSSWKGNWLEVEKEEDITWYRKDK